MENKKWFTIAISCVGISVLSLFTSIISYTNVQGVQFHYSIIGLLQGDNFSDTVLTQYYGPVLWNMVGSTVSILSVLFIASLICSIIGLFTLRAQRPNKWNFRLTIIGLIGTTFPSFMVILAVILSGNYFNGSIMCGISPIITPIAMAFCIRVVFRRRNKVIQQLQAEMKAKGLIWNAGDL